MASGRKKASKKVAVEQAERLAEEHGISVYAVLRHGDDFGWNDDEIRQWFTLHPSPHEAEGSMSAFLRPERDIGTDYDLARFIASETGANPYQELEDKFRWTRDEIRTQFLDTYRYDSQLMAYLDEGDVSCTNEELGLNEEGEPEDA